MRLTEKLILTSMVLILGLAGMSWIKNPVYSSVDKTVEEIKEAGR